MRSDIFFHGLREGEIGSSIPGTVAKILVESGDRVEENQLVAIIEAMKMETQITAATTGIVAAIAVKEGQNIKAGKLLIRLV